MAASEPTRRRRYIRQALTTPLALTPRQLALLQYVGSYRLISLPQLALLAAASEKSCRRAMRPLFDGGLVAVLPVPRVALADARVATDPLTYLHGSAPNFFTLTPAGQLLLQELDAADVEPPPGPLGSRYLFLAHSVAVTDVRIWSELTARHYPGHEVRRWVDGRKAEITLAKAPRRKVIQPDAWFTYWTGDSAMVAFVEVDRATERRGCWEEKLANYQILFQPHRLVQEVGYPRARVIVVAPDSSRRDCLAKWISAIAPPALAARFWLAERAALSVHSLTARVWRQPGREQLGPLVSMAADPTTTIESTNHGGEPRMPSHEPMNGATDAELGAAWSQRTSSE